MYRAELQKLEGVWTGIERVLEGPKPYEASARLVFQTVFDGKFLLCDYVQSAPDQPTSVGHGVFRWDDRTQALTVTWFRSPAATPTQQADAVAAGDKLIFVEVADGTTTRTTYVAVRDQLSIRTERELADGSWQPIVEGTYRRR